MKKETEFHVLQGRSAGFVTRLIAYLTDLAVVAGLLALTGWLVVVADSVIAGIGLDPGVDLATLYAFMVPFIIATYYVVLWSLTGRTVGKWLMGLKVVGRNGEPPSVRGALVRLIGYGISALAAWAGYLWVIIDDERQAWHDHLARTWVIYDYERRRRGEIYETYRRRTRASQGKGR